MSREYRVPFVLWVCTALLAHVLWSGSAELASRVLGQIADIRLFAQGVRQDVKGSGTFEVSLVEDSPPAEPPKATEPPPEPKPPEVKPPEPEKEKPKPPEPKPEPEKKPLPPKPEPKPIVLLPTPPAPPPPPPPPPPPKDGRIAVKQHVKDKNQKDNPNAPFVGDEANTVKEQSVARATSHDQDDPKPTFGGQKAGPTQSPGNSDHNKVGDSDDHPGEPNKAPGEASKDNSSLPAAPPAPKSTVDPNAPPKPPTPPAPGNGVRPQPATQPQPTPPPVTNPNPDKGAAGPDVVAADKGGYSLNPRRKPGGPQASSSAIAKAPPVPTVPGLGLGKGPNERGVQLNLNQRDVVASVGADTLRRERAADGERRRSAHRGSWQSSTFERWRPAIENYVSSVRPGNQTALNTARVPFGTYLVSIHNKIHPIFADGFLDSLDGLPPGHPMNDQKIFTALEIVVDREQGRIVRMGVTRTSGITAFDIAALDSVHRSQPFGKPPEAILSADGNVYLHWEFHRNPIFACSTMNARPYMLNRPPPLQQPNQPAPTPGQPSDPREKGVPPAPAPGGDRSRYGIRLLPLPGSQG